jgi:hypothetical protein
VPRSALVVLLALGLSSTVHAASYRDPRDAGRSRLDIKNVAAGVIDDKVRFTLTMHRDWPSTLLRRTGADRYVCFYVWREGRQPLPGRQDIQICASYSGRLRAQAFDRTANKMTPVRVRRRRADGIQFTVPITLIGGRTMHWLGVSKDGRTGKGFDIAPRGPRSLELVLEQA